MERIQKIVEEITEEKPTECSNTNNIYQNIPKEPQLQKEKLWTIPLLLESPKSKHLQTKATQCKTDAKKRSSISVFFMCIYFD